MPGNSDEQKNLLPGLKPVLELLKCDPDRVDAVYVRKGRAGGESGRVLDACRATLKIPMRDRCESLNAAVAASVVLWEGWR